MNKQEYAAYLKSAHWKALRGEKQRRAKKRTGELRCAICAATNNLHTHHLQYRNIYDVLTSDLRMLCDRCHSVAHELLNSGELVTRKYKSHHAMFCVTKEAVKKKLGLTGRNLFAENDKAVDHAAN